MTRIPDLAVPLTYITDPAHFCCGHLVDAAGEMVAKPMGANKDGIARFMTLAPDLFKALMEQEAFLVELHRELRGHDGLQYILATRLKAVRATLASVTNP